MQAQVGSGEDAGGGEDARVLDMEFRFADRDRRMTLPQQTGPVPAGGGTAAVQDSGGGLLAGAVPPEIDEVPAKTYPVLVGDGIPTALPGIGSPKQVREIRQKVESRTFPEPYDVRRITT
ncbi:hypothetical protein [Embleya sp. NPDC059237]|uniref:hypothetical protein n=1 Tax=Embleya sp. NPDC059237 TaxID=3346784 RepID=UPI003676B955